MAWTALMGSLTALASTREVGIYAACCAAARSAASLPTVLQRPCVGDAQGQPPDCHLPGKPASGHGGAGRAALRRAGGRHNVGERVLQHVRVAGARTCEAAELTGVTHILYPACRMVYVQKSDTQYDTVDSLLSYLVFALLTPRQQALTVFHSL